MSWQFVIMWTRIIGGYLLFVGAIIATGLMLKPVLRRWGFFQEQETSILRVPEGRGSSGKHDPIKTDFQYQLAEKRRYGRIAVTGISVWFIVWLAYMVIRPSPGSFLNSILGLITVGIWLPLIVMGMVVRPRLECPSCQQRLDNALDRFCPECGAAAKIVQRGWFRLPRCASCSKALIKGKHEGGWRICYCTYCGVALDPPVPESA